MIKIWLDKFKTHFPSFTTYSAFALLFCMLPYRILGILQFDIVVKVFTLVFCFVVFYHFLRTNKTFLSYILQSKILQYFFFTMIRFENLIWNMSPFMRYLFLISFGFNLGAWPSESNDPTFYYMLFLFIYTFYNQLKVLFLNPDFEASTYDSSSYDGENAKNFTWEDIIKNMSSISLRFFGRPVSNQLGKEKESIAFPHMAKRYVFTRILTGVKKYPEMATFATAFGGMFGFTVSEFYKGKRHVDIYTEAKRANAEAKRANAEAKRANDLKEVELGIKSEKEYRVAYGVGEPNQKDQTQNLPSSSQAKPSIQEKSEAVNVSCSLEESFSSTIFKYLRLDLFF